MDVVVLLTIAPVEYFSWSQIPATSNSSDTGPTSLDTIDERRG
jgi:hypothetical protein